MALKGVNLEFFIKGLGVQALKPQLFNDVETDAEFSDRVSYLGTPVFSNLEIPSGVYKTDDGEEVVFDGVRIDTVLFNVTIDKNIVKTPINGQNGTVKQFISLGDHSISCEGIIVGTSDEENNGFSVGSTGRVPESEIRKLNEIFAVPQEIEIVSEFLDFFDVSTVVIENGVFSQKEGYRDSIYFSLNMISDAPIELK